MSFLSLALTHPRARAPPFWPPPRVARPSSCVGAARRAGFVDRKTMLLERQQQQQQSSSSSSSSGANGAGDGADAAVAAALTEAHLTVNSDLAADQNIDDRQSGAFSCFSLCVCVCVCVLRLSRLCVCVCSATLLFVGVFS